MKSNGAIGVDSNRMFLERQRVKFGRHVGTGVVWLFLFLGFGFLGRADQVVISELMHAPPEGQSSWVELHNLTATPFDIAEWRLKGRHLTYPFAVYSDEDPERSFLRPFERVLISSVEPSVLRSELGLESKIRIFGPWQGSMGFEEDKLKLEDKNGVMLSGVSFGKGRGWPLESIGTGHTLELVNENSEIDLAANWRASISLGGSPGEASVPLGGVLLDLPETPNFESIPIWGFQSTWKYDARGRELDSAWRGLGFDDSNWSTGDGLFGFEESSLPAPGLKTRLRKGGVAYYFRKTFHYEGGSAEVSLAIDQIVDDGAIYYLNGKRIGRIRMRAGLPVQRAFATETVTNAVLEKDVIVADGEFLRQGENVLAVQVHQSTRDSSDLVFGCRLRLLRPIEEVLRITQVGIGTDNRGTIELSNLRDEAIDLSQFVLRLTGEGGQEVEDSMDSILAANDRITRSFDKSEMFDGKLREVAVWQVTEDRLMDQVSIVHLSKGWVQTRDSSRMDQWYLQRIESLAIDPGTPRPGQKDVFLSEVFFSDDRLSAWLEVANRGSQTIPAGDILLGTESGASSLVALEIPLPAGEHKSIQIEGDFSRAKQRVTIRNRIGETLSVCEFKLSSMALHFSRDPKKSREWSTLSSVTRDLGNDSVAEIPVVINEIMADPAFGNEQGEFLELYNFGPEPVDLSGARFTEGVDFRFPPNSFIPAGGYLVLADNSEWLQESYPSLSKVYQYKGKLRNAGERIRLIDARGNLIDECFYQLEGDWPAKAAGRGSSLELVHPSLDNTRSSAWKDSSIERASGFRRYEFRGRYDEVAKMGRVKDYRELHLHLVGESHIVLRNLELRRVDSDKNLIGDLVEQSQDAFGDDARWLIQGNHADSFVEGGRLHLIAHGHGDNRANRAEIDVPSLRDGLEYVLSFEARWVSGSPRLIAHTWDNSFYHSFRIDVPQGLGSPGRQNSRYHADPPPMLENLVQGSVVPRPGQDVSVSVDVAGRGDIVVELCHRLVSGEVAKRWVIDEMVRDQSLGEEGFGNTYTGSIDGYDDQGDVVEYFVRVRTAAGLSQFLPRRGEEGPALLIYDDRQIQTDLRTVRLIISPKDLESMLGWNNRTAAKYPRLSNQYFNATFVSNEKEVFHNAELRRSGSPWTRRGALTRGKWKLPKDREFRGHGKFSFDDDPDQWTRHHNRVVRYLLYLLGHPVGENEFVRVLINTDPAMLREDVEPVDADFLNRNFKNGNEGELYRIDDQWWFSDDWRQSHRDASWEFNGSKSAAWYRNSWMKRSREEDDDYSRLIDFFELVSSEDYSSKEMQRWLDADQIMKMTAVMGFVGDWDSFTQRRGKNAYFYRRPNDGRFQFLQWDTDLAFQRRGRGRGFYGGRRAFVSWVQRPENFARLKIGLAQLNDICNKNPGRMKSWMRAETLANPHTSINSSLYLDWFARQERNVEEFLSR